MLTDERSNELLDTAVARHQAMTREADPQIRDRMARELNCYLSQMEAHQRRFYEERIREFAAATQPNSLDPAAPPSGNSSS